MVVTAKSLKTQFTTDLENGRIFKWLEAFPSVDKVTFSFYQDDDCEKSAPIAEAELDLICVDQLSDADACGVGVFDADTLDAFAELEESYIPLFTQDVDGDGIFYADAVLKSLYVDEDIDDSLALTIINEMDWLLQFTLNIELRNLIVKIDQENPDHEKQLLDLFLRSFMVVSKEPLYLARNYRLFR